MDTEPTPQAPRKRGRPKGSTKKKAAPSILLPDITDSSGIIEEVGELLDKDELTAFTESPQAAVKADKQKHHHKRAPLTRAEKVQMLAEVRSMMMVPLAPREIVTAVSKKWNVSWRFAEMVLERVQDQQRDHTGFARVQFRELAQRALRDILKAGDDKATASEKLKAIAQADTLFGIADRPGEDKEHEQRLLRNLMPAINEMSEDELEELETRLKAGRLDDVFENPAIDPDEIKLTPRADSRRSRVANKNRRG